MRVSLLFLVTSFMVHPLNASPSRLTTHVKCREEAGINIRNNDCHQLLGHVQAITWFREQIKWGRGQPWPGDIPRTYTYSTCRLKFLATHPESTETEVIALSDYWEDITLVYDICLGYRKSAGGKVVIGKAARFYAFLGDQAYDSFEGNVSRFRDADSRQLQ